MDTKETRNKLKTAQINNALGVFILTFGLIVMIAMVFTETFVQKMTDLTAGAVLVLIGSGMIWKARKTIKILRS